METLLLKFQPGSPSHYYVITTLSDLATCNPTHVVPFLKTILSTMMSNIKTTKKDYLRYETHGKIEKKNRFGVDRGIF